MGALEHPVERREGEPPGGFETAAQRVSYFASSPTFFVFCLALVGTWIASYVVGASREFTHGVGVTMTAVTLLLVALLKNSELRSERAIQEKLDALATAMLEERRSDGDGDDAAPMLDRAISLEDEL